MDSARGNATRERPDAYFGNPPRSGRGIGKDADPDAAQARRLRAREPQGLSRSAAARGVPPDTAGSLAGAARRLVQPMGRAECAEPAEGGARGRVKLALA